MDRLVGAEADEGGLRRTITFLEDAHPPIYGPTGIEEEVQDAEDDAAPPAQGQPEQERVNGSMDPAGGVAQVCLVERHPVILQEPVRHQVGD